MLTVESLCFGPFSENTYLLINESKECIVIDPGAYTIDEKRNFNDYIISSGLQLQFIFLTHTHIDHIFGLADLKRTFNVPILGHPLCANGMKGSELAARLYGLQLEAPPPVDRYVN